MRSIPCFPKSPCSYPLVPKSHETRGPKGLPLGIKPCPKGMPSMQVPQQAQRARMANLHSLKITQNLKLTPPTAARMKKTECKPSPHTPLPSVPIPQSLTPTRSVPFFLCPYVPSPQSLPPTKRGGPGGTPAAKPAALPSVSSEATRERISQIHA